MTIKRKPLVATLEDVARVVQHMKGDAGNDPEECHVLHDALMEGFLWALVDCVETDDVGVMAMAILAATPETRWYA